MPREYVESINYEYNKTDGQTYINVNVVRPVEKIKTEIESHHSTKLSRAKSSLKSSTGKSQNQQQEQDLLAQQQLQQQQQQQLEQQQSQQQQQQQYEQQQEEQQEQEYQEQQEEGEVYEEGEQDQYEEEDVQDEEADGQEREHVLPNGRNLNEELIRIEMKKLELKELELRRSEIRDLEQRRNDLLKSITILRRRRGCSSEPIRTLSSLSSRPSSVESVHRSNQTRNTRATVKRQSATSRPQAPSNYQNGSGAVHHQPSTRTIAQVPPETRNRTVREVSNTVYEPQSQTEFERQLNLPSKSHWANAVQNQTNQVWLNGGGFQVSPGPFPAQQYGANFSQNQFNNQEFLTQKAPTQNFAQPAIQQVPNQFGAQQSFGSSPALVPQAPDQPFGQQTFAQNQNFNHDMSQLNQPSFPNQFQQAQMPQMNSSVNFQAPQQNYFQ